MAPEDGKANKQAVRLLVKEMNLSTSALSIVRGLTSRNKMTAVQKAWFLRNLGRYSEFFPKMD